MEYTFAFSLRGTLAAVKAAATLRRLQLPYSEIERRRRGFIVLQIDALSFEDLHRAMEQGTCRTSVRSSTHPTG
jgi:hypothetical protein